MHGSTLIRLPFAILSRKKMNSKAARTCQPSGQQQHCSVIDRPGWAETSTNLVRLDGHFETAVYAFQFHSGQQQTFRAGRRSNLDRMPATLARPMSTKTDVKHKY